jgi:hypothetical protein
MLNVRFHEDCYGRPLLDICVNQNVPLALNPSSAELLILGMIRLQNASTKEKVSLGEWGLYLLHQQCFGRIATFALVAGPFFPFGFLWHCPIQKCTFGY